MRKSKCKHCMKGIVLNPECDRVVSEYYCDIDAYDEETGCTNCPYKKKKKRGEVMTRQEQAKFKRLEKRHRNLFSALCIIKTWLSFHDDPHERIYHIAKLVTEKIEEDRLAEKKESERNENLL